jgi:hypothetical protein
MPSRIMASSLARSSTDACPALTLGSLTHLRQFRDDPQSRVLVFQGFTIDERLRARKCSATIYIL